MSQQELLKKIIQVLDQSEIQYMITGSVVSSLQGEPRSTHDIDVIISIQKSEIKKLIEGFPSTDFYLDEDSILNTIGRNDMFNLIDLHTGDKVDFWMLTNDPFDQSRFSRRICEEFMGMKMRVSSPEDTIIAKLRWSILCGGSEKQFIDALRVYELQYEKLDRNYIKKWVKKLNLELLWKQLLDEAEEV